MSNIKHRLRAVRLVVLDVDGTMTDGSIYIDNNRNEMKRFNVKDGLGIITAEQAGIEFMILTGRNSGSVAQRAEELKIRYVFQGISDKEASLKEFMRKENYSRAEVAYVGDDLNDAAAMRLAGCRVCPADAAKEIRRNCEIVLKARGGDGAVREFIEQLLESKDSRKKKKGELWKC